MITQHETLYTLESVILPPLYLFDPRPTIRSHDDVMAKQPLACGQPIEEDDDDTFCSLYESTSSILPPSLLDTATDTTAKRVTFAPINNGLVTEYPASTALIEDECEAMWYRSSDFKYFRKYGKKLATLAAASKYGTDLLKTCNACGDTTKNDASLAKYSKIANSAARGLEILVAPQLNKDRRGAIRSVLKAQEKLNDGGATTAEREEMLSATSQILSRQTRIMARLLGSGDAHVAATFQKEE